jgi:hypothetical protein
MNAALCSLNAVCRLSVILMFNLNTPACHFQDGGLKPCDPTLTAWTSFSPPLPFKAFCFSGRSSSGRSERGSRAIGRPKRPQSCRQAPDSAVDAHVPVRPAVRDLDRWGTSGP